jgi:hypothetical protein
MPGAFAEVAPAYLVPGKTMELCRRPYPGHARGCPNFTKKKGCPPGAKPLADVLDLTRPLWAAWNCFLFGEHVAHFKKKHPRWSKRQLECCLYWQGTARKQLSMVIEVALAQFPASAKDTVVLRCPEAHGVNVTATMLSLGVKLEWPPVTVAYQVALIGVAKR